MKKKFLKNNKLLTFILAGGEGKRLYPLTKDRAKPAVPFGGIYRIIDFTLTNCLLSAIRRIIVLTQYKSISLNRHILKAWNFFRNELDEFMEIIPPQQRVSSNWYQGTADAIYQNIYTIEHHKPDIILILSGDHIYKMDYRKMIRYHLRNNADVTIGGIEINASDSKEFGILVTDKNNKMTGFQEKPDKPHTIPDKPDKALASMGIYIFNTKLLVKSLMKDAKTEQSAHDFGKNIIPMLLNTGANIQVYPFIDENKKETLYWRDVGTLDAYYEANMDLVQVDPLFNLYDPDWCIRTYMEQVPPAKTVFAQEKKGGRLGIALDSIVSGGCIISGGRVQRSVLSPHVRVNSYCRINSSILMEGVVVGRHSKIKNAIIDKSVLIPENSVIGYDVEKDRKNFTVTKNGIVVIPKEKKLTLS
ncbi:glucose-1-phosphate adenylyltransferase [bacterium]|nr:glucose-1-phosphate adenylyltransferase [bacterium]